MSELKPCPFCGYDGVALIWDLDLCRIRCKNCGTRGPWEFSEDQAEEAWNRRAEDGKRN